MDFVQISAFKKKKKGGGDVISVPEIRNFHVCFSHCSFDKSKSVFLKVLCRVQV